MDAELRQLFEWLNFEEPEIDLLEAEGFTDFDDLVSTTPKEVKSMLDGFNRRSDVEINIPIKRSKLLYDMLHWSCDFDRRSMDTGLNWPNEEINDAQAAFDAMYVARERAVVRQRNKDRSSEDVQGPGEFSSNEYIAWEKALENKLSSISGIKDVPLSYVIRKNEVADDDDLIDQTFLELTVLQAPLEGATFEADSREVHQIIVANTAGTDAQDFLKRVRKHQCGRRDMLALRDFFGGSGTINRRLQEAKLVLKHLHYKSERTLPFASFVAKLTGIFEVLSDGGQEKGEQEKVEIFFEKFQCDSLSNEIIASKFDYGRNGGTFADTANTMADHVKPLAPNQQFGRNGRQVSAIGTTHTGQPPDAGIYLSNGSIFTGKYDNAVFNLLSREEKEALRTARSGHKGGGNGRDKGSRKIKATKRKNTIKLKKVNQQLKDARRSIAALKATKDEAMPPAAPAADAPPASSGSAGTSFGGRSGAPGNRG